MIIGLYGLSDTGKTTIIEGLTNTVMRKYAKEQVKSITLKVNYASYSYENRQWYFLDAPGHTVFTLETLRNLCHIDIPLYVIDCLNFKDSQKRKTILKHYSQYQNLFQYCGLKSVLIFNKAETATAEELAFYYKTLHKLSNNFTHVYPLCAILPESLTFLKQQLNLVPDQSKKSTPQTAITFQTIKSFDVNPLGVWLSELKGGVLGGIKSREIQPQIKLHYYDALINDWNHVVVKHVKTFSDNIVTIETKSDPYFFKNDRMKGVLFFEQLDETVKSDYRDFFRIKVDRIYNQLQKDYSVRLLVNGQLASGLLKPSKNNTCDLRLKKECGMIYSPKNAKVIVLRDSPDNAEKMELLYAGHVV